MGDRVGDEPVDLIRLDNAGRHQRGDALDGREQDETHALGVAGPEHAAGLTLLDQLEHDREGPLGSVVKLSGRVPVLAGEHQLEQRWVANREPDVGPGRRPQPPLELLTCTVDRAAELGFEPGKAGLRERVQQRLAIGEVAPRRGVADSNLPCQVAQGQILHATLADGLLGLSEQRRAQIAVVISPVGQRRRSVADNVVIDSIVVIDYIVAHDNIQQRKRIPP